VKVAVIGGSITGCTAAIELSRLGCEVVLFERSGEELKDRGAGIAVPPSALDTYVQRGLIAPDVPYFNARNFVRRWRTAAEPEYGYLAWEQPTSMVLLNWGMLYRNLRERVPDGIYRTEHKVIALKGLQDRVQVVLADGRMQEFDLVVCADGYASLGRKALFPEIEVSYAGYVLWRGSLHESALSLATPLESGIHALGYPGGHGIFYFVPGAEGATSPGSRLINWALYLPVPELATFMVDRAGRVHDGSLPPGAMPLATEARLKTEAQQRLPDYYARMVAASHNTYAYAIYDCEVPAYRVDRLCLAGDAGAFARPHSGAGALKGMNDAITLRTTLETHADLETALAEWNSAQTESGNKLVRFGNQLGRALVREIPDWSTMDAVQMEHWFKSMVTIDTEMFDATPRRA
jgi:2-polyprenyl-6-methoxyphenol hydroxylase-like FAD-dependent oxidoreductase